MGCWVYAWGSWKAGVSVSWWEDLGRVSGSEELGVLGEVESGSVRENGGVSGLALVVEGWK